MNVQFTFHAVVPKYVHPEPVHQSRDTSTCPSTYTTAATHSNMQQERTIALLSTDWVRFLAD